MNPSDNKVFRRNGSITPIGLFYKNVGRLWRVSDCEELVGVTWSGSDCEELVGVTWRLSTVKFNQ